MISIERYTDDKKECWNQFNCRSKNGLFMFDRNYMDYHRDRFTDYSLLFFYKGKLLAILPMSEHKDCLVSHGGLTYGGFITDENMKQHLMMDCFEALKKYAKEKGFSCITYKCIPHIFHKQPADEDRFALFANGAKLIAVDVSTYVNLSSPLKMTKGRKAQISRAKREGIVIAEKTDREDYKQFIELENDVLKARHGVHAVHTGDELSLLHDRFPENIRLFAAMKDDKMIAGTVVYEYDQTVHTQYMAANEEARIVGGLDLTILNVAERYKNTKKWLDFGISTDHDMVYLNDGLCAQKESFGGRTGVYETWELTL